MDITDPNVLHGDPFRGVGVFASAISASESGDEQPEQIRFGERLYGMLEHLGLVDKPTRYRVELAPRTRRPQANV